MKKEKKDDHRLVVGRRKEADGQHKKKKRKNNSLPDPEKRNILTMGRYSYLAIAFFQHPTSNRLHAIYFLTWPRSPNVAGHCPIVSSTKNSFATYILESEMYVYLTVTQSVFHLSHFFVNTISTMRLTTFWTLEQVASLHGFLNAIII
jgi:hypothetical protein